jgi:hypothetical protein
MRGPVAPGAGIGAEMWLECLVGLHVIFHDCGLDLAYLRNAMLAPARSNIELQISNLKPHALSNWESN